MGLEELENRTYKLVLRKTARGPVIQFRSATPERRESTLIRIGGQKAKEIFETMVEVLKKYEYIIEEGGSENYKYFKLRKDIGPVVGGFLVLLRRSRNPEKWIPLFEGFITEDPYKGAHVLLSHVLSVSIALSKVYPPPERVRMQLSPKVVDSVSAGFKSTVKKLWNLGED
ncbi:MAG: hypothetical protein F7C36_03035 [Desulfurococcales archaeon]|nr:hypothetical protein [Desulfurococcales archaeon]